MCGCPVSCPIVSDRLCVGVCAGYSSVLSQNANISPTHSLTHSLTCTHYTHRTRTVYTHTHKHTHTFILSFSARFCTSASHPSMSSYCSLSFLLCLDIDYNPTHSFYLNIVFFFAISLFNALIVFYLVHLHVCFLRNGVIPNISV